MSPFLFHVLLEVVASAIKQEKGIKPHKLEQRKKTYLFIITNVVYTESPKLTFKKSYNQKSKFIKFAEYNASKQKSTEFLYVGKQNLKTRLFSSKNNLVS